MSLGKREVNSERLPKECGLPTQKLCRKQVGSKVQDAHVRPHSHHRCVCETALPRVPELPYRIARTQITDKKKKINRS